MYEILLHGHSTMDKGLIITFRNYVPVFKISTSYANLNPYRIICKNAFFVNDFRENSIDLLFFFIFQVKEEVSLTALRLLQMGGGTSVRVQRG